MFKWFRDRKEKRDKEAKLLADYVAKRPLVWWIDDLTHSVCGLIDHPTRGLEGMPWPDCDEVYLAIDKLEYDRVVKELKDLRKRYQAIKDTYGLK